MANCPWITDPDTPPLCVDEAVWLAIPVDVREAAIEFATDFLNASTGRQFGLCPITVRPCMERRCNSAWSGWWAWNGSLWTPYIFEGEWFNCFCGSTCCCEPRCEVRLAGPVNSIIEIQIGGVVVDPDTYRVDDYQWLVREGGECWPECPHMDDAAGEPGTWTVTYVRGRPVPAALINATLELAYQWILACQGSAECKLSSWVVAMTRQDVALQFPNPVQMIQMGLTGIRHIDMLIRTYNPSNLPYQPRVFSQAIRYPRQTTTP